MPRVVVISDIHGNLTALKSAWADASHRRADVVLFLGDLVAFGPDPKAVIEFMRDEINPAVALRGNTDRYLLDKVWEDSDCTLPEWTQKSLAWTAKKLGKRGLKYLAELTDETDHEIDGLHTYLCHATPGNDELGVLAGKNHELGPIFEKVEADAIFCGHTHKPLRTRVAGKHVVNVGSVGFPFDRDPRSCWVSFIVGGGSLQEISFSRTSFNLYETIRNLEECEMPGANIMAHRLRTASSSLPKSES